MSKSIAFLLGLALLIAFLMTAGPGFSSNLATENSWVPRASMQGARGSLGTVAVNGKIYAIGGSNGTVEEYDPATDTWTFKKPMPTPRISFSNAAFENRIYCIGGYLNNRSITGVNEVYDPATDTWMTKAAMPTPRLGLQANVAAGRIYLIGGYLPPDPPGSRITAVSVNEAYDPETNSWTAMSPLPYSLDPVASAVIDNVIFVFGGLYEGSVYASLNLIYDAETDAWSEGPTPPSTVEYGEAAATTGVNASKRIYVLVRDYSPRALPLRTPEQLRIQLRVYDPRSETWTEGVALPTYRLAFGFAVLDDLLYAVGGHNILLNSTIPHDWGSEYLLEYATNERYTPFDYGTPDTSPIVLPDRTAPTVTVLLPENKSYTSNNVILSFTIDEPVIEIAYCLDGKANVTVAGNTTLTGVSLGKHNVTAYATDMAGNSGASETVTFEVNEERVPDTFPAFLVVVASATVAGIVAVGLLVWRKRTWRLFASSL